MSPRRLSSNRELIDTQAGYVLHKTLELLGLPPSNIFVHVLSKGTNVHSSSEIDTVEKLVEEHDIERVVVLDQGSRPGPVVRNLKDGLGAVLVIDHHQSDEVSEPAVAQGRKLNDFSIVSRWRYDTHGLQKQSNSECIPVDIPHMSSTASGSAGEDRLGGFDGYRGR